MSTQRALTVPSQLHRIAALGVAFLAAAISTVVILVEVARHGANGVAIVAGAVDLVATLVLAFVTSPKFGAAHATQVVTARVATAPVRAAR